MTDRLAAGLYAQLITEELSAALDHLDDALHPERTKVHAAEASDRIAQHLARAIERAVASIPEGDRVEVGLGIARALLLELSTNVEEMPTAPWLPSTPLQLLTAINKRGPKGEVLSLPQPKTPLLDTALLTNAPGEPHMVSQVISEIGSAQQIDLIMAFIRSTGVRPIVAALRDFTATGGVLRVLTTTYTGSTELQALQALADLGAEVRVSYDTTNTRLHAKAWLFHRQAGASTAFVGSSNLTHQAQVTGLEWNLRLSGLRNPSVVQRIAALFDSYWEGGDFEPLDAAAFATAMAASNRQASTRISSIKVTARPFQKMLLEQLRFSRSRGHHRNLLVAATGTGKTVMAALDYQRQCIGGQYPSLLFVAHRKEILEQSLATFRQVLQVADFGELWGAGKTPAVFRHVFASIQTLHRQDLERLSSEHFAVVIVDEFHHAAANSYQSLLNHVQPNELLGLTATPERADGQSVLDHFGGRIAAELRLWDAIDQHYLVPFHYYGINDDVDLRQIPWKRGQGYDVQALTKVYTANDAWARVVLNQLLAHVGDHDSMRVLGFCVTVDHAHFMARFFASHGVPAAAVDGTTPQQERDAALQRLRSGDLRVLFSVDLFNEGVDLPAVNTVLLLRPTESATLFMQQLGRGLRRDDGKAVCTVLDFVGQHRREFRFDLRLRALLGGTRRDVEEQVKDDFPFLPSGCHMHLDRVAKERVLDSLKQAVPSHWAQLKSEAALLLRQGMQPTLAALLAETGLELEDLYANKHCWSDLREALGLPVAAAGPQEVALRRAVGRLLHVDDPVRAGAWLGWVQLAKPPVPERLGAQEQRLLRMLVVSLVESVPMKVLPKSASLADGLALLWQHPQVLAELTELVPLLEARCSHVEQPLANRPDNPLQIHGQYSRNEILAAFADGDGARVPTWREGTRWLQQETADVFVFTLDKTDGNFSPSTRYNDYALSERLIHWESQSMTRAGSETGKRYINHQQRGSEVMLFARMRQQDRAFWFLGSARYVRHQGEQPMQVVWELAEGLPADLYVRFRAVVD